MLEFARAIRASDNPDPELEFIVTSMSEWQAPQRRSATKKVSARTADEGREGFSYRILRWPAFVLLWGNGILMFRFWYWLGWHGLRISLQFGDLTV